MKSFRYKGQAFHHGDKVTCEIRDIVISDGKISIDDSTAVFICQNEKDGAPAEDRLGYSFSWNIGYTNSLNAAGNSVYDLRKVSNKDDDKTMKSFEYKKQVFHHGDRVTCKIQSKPISDAKISISNKDEVFICQNVKDGSSAPDKLGYKYSWTIDFIDDLQVSANGVTVLRKVLEGGDYEIF